MRRLVNFLRLCLKTRTQKCCVSVKARLGKIVGGEFMAAATYEIEAGSRQKLRGMRVVVCDPDQQVRASLRAAIEADSSLVLAAEACSWAECEIDLAFALPELLIVRSSMLPRGWGCNSRQDGSFPVVILLHDAATQPASGEDYGRMPLPIDPRTSGPALNCAVAEIYRRKTMQLSDLLSHYMAGLGEVRRYPSTIAVERDAMSIELPTESILAVVAARKSVRIYSARGSFLLRKPIHQLAEELDPSLFVRIHRSIIVNLNHLDASALAEDRSSHVVLSDGTRYPIGLNYRESIARLLISRRAS
jgi:DNA-binding LytR/AlgR family response regulator